jgi:hypothetical protein
MTEGAAIPTHPTITIMAAVYRRAFAISASFV